jgi:hypothetical protein
MTFIKYLWITEPKRKVVHQALSRLEKNLDIGVEHVEEEPKDDV